MQGATQVIFTGVAGGVHPGTAGRATSWSVPIACSTMWMWPHWATNWAPCRVSCPPGRRREVANHRPRSGAGCGRCARAGRPSCQRRPVHRLPRRRAAALDDVRGGLRRDGRRGSGSGVQQSGRAVRGDSQRQRHRRPDANVDYRTFMPLVARHAKQVVRGMLSRLAAAPA